MVKPWDSGSSAGAPALPSSAPPAIAVVTPEASAPTERGAARSRYCEYAGGWRIASIERSAGTGWYAWKAIDPAVGLLGGPDDPAIPFVEVIAERVLALGYCAPWMGPDRPDEDSTMSVWRVAGTAPVERLSLRERSPARPTILGALFTSPGTGEGWPAGRYVFRVGDHWLGVEVRLVAEAPAGPAGASPSPSPSQSLRP